MFIAALFIIANLGNSPDAPQLMNEFRKCDIYIYTMEFYLALKKNESMLFAGDWMELENIMLSKVSQAQKVKAYMFSFICIARPIS
jgi:hypothetical protein